MMPTTTDTPVIAIDNLVRRYGRTDAVNGLSLRVPAGRCTEIEDVLLHGLAPAP